MQTTETLNEGLKRAIRVTVPADELETKLTAKLDDVRGRVKLNGFRPGKVPPKHLRKMYGKSMMAEIVQEIVDERSSGVLRERGEKSATRPHVKMSEDEAEAERVLDGKADFAFDITYEVMPEIEVGDLSDIEVERPVVEIADEEVEEQVRKVAASAQEYKTKKGKAAKGDRVTIDYVGKVDGEAFDGGTGEGANLVLGSGTFIPGFEEQVVGLKAGEEKTIEVTFPEEYQAEHLAGKAATFDVTVKEVAKAAELVIDDELAAKLGLESADKLREIVRDQIEGQFGRRTRERVKRQLLDALDERFKFDAPEQLVNAEFSNIWSQVTRELEEAKKTFEDEDTTEEAAREEYRGLADRRVRLGLVLAEIGEAAKVKVEDNELQAALMQQVRQYPGQEKEIYEFFRSNPDAVASLRAPIFEEKVVDHLMTVVKVEDRKVTKEELIAMDEDEHDHDHSHGHDHAHDHSHDHDHAGHDHDH